MNTFLDKFRSKLKAIQARQVIAFLTREKDKGSITTVEEFKSRLKELTQKVSSTKILPTLEVYLGIYGEKIDSESFNFMLQQIEDDLKAAFNEANDINEILNSHETIINDVVLTNLELAINDIESQLDALEFINNTSFGFDNAIFNTFRITQNNRTAFNQGIIFFDPKTVLKSGPSTEASIDFIGEKLLSRAKTNKIKISSVKQVFDSEATGTELSVEFDNNSPLNIIDSRPGTFWVQSTLLTNQRKETGVLTKLEFDLSNVQNINYVQIEPIALSSIYLYRIDIIDESNQVKTILENPVEIKNTNKLFFSKVSTKKIILVFQNKNFFETQFEVKAAGPLTVIRNQSSTNSDLLDSITNDLNEVISNPRIKSALGLNEKESIHKRYYEYIFGLTNIEIGESEFEENSIFVSNTEKVKKLSQVGVRTLEKRPFSVTSDSTEIEYTTNVHPSNDEDIYFYASNEFYLMKRDYDANGLLLNSHVVPVLPIGTTKIRHERIYLKDKSSSILTTNDVGYLQFYCSDSIEDIKVYRNGELLGPTNLVDINPIETDGWLKNTSLSIESIKTGKPMRIAIQIQQPNPADIYTVSYTPTLSSSRNIPVDTTVHDIEIVDTSGFLDSWIGLDNLNYFSQFKKGKEIDYSLINLIIVMRRNSSDAKLSSVVEEYLLATSSINQNKFGD